MNCQRQNKVLGFKRRQLLVFLFKNMFVIPMYSQHFFSYLLHK
jgi:hypothetical protein